MVTAIAGVAPADSLMGGGPDQLGGGSHPLDASGGAPTALLLMYALGPSGGAAAAAGARAAGAMGWALPPSIVSIASATGITGRDEA